MILRVIRSQRNGAFLIAWMLVAATATKAEAGYTFTLIADSAGPFSVFNSFSPSLNNLGTVAFVASLDIGGAGVFSGKGGSITTIAATPIGNPLNPPSINDAGTVAFTSGDRILAGNGGPLVTIADTAGQFRDFYAGYTASVNTAGTVAFVAALDIGPAGIFSSSEGMISPILVNSASSGSDGNFTMNDSGTIAFRMGNGTAVAKLDQGSITTIADSTGSFNYFGSTPSINSVGTVAFVAGVGGIDGGTYGIYSGNGGPLTTIADRSGPFSAFPSFNSGNPSINGSGTVAFIAGLDIGGAGIFVGDGTATSNVIGIGDALFGSTVSTFNISPTSLNDAGQVAFYYRLSNGTTGIAVATPVPEPSTSLLLAFGMGMSFARRTRRRS